MIVLSVRGGSDGIEAHYDDMMTLARLVGAAGAYTAEHSLGLHKHLADPDVLCAAVLDPVGAARFSGALLDALDGPNGLTWISAECGANDLKLRTAAATYLTADRIRAQVEPALDGLYRLGPIAASDIVGDAHRVRSPDGLITSDPQAVDTAMALPWLQPGLMNVVALCPDGRPAVTARGVDTTPVATAPPRGLHDLLSELNHRYPTGTGGDVDIRFVYSTGPDGRPVRHVIVDIPGVTSFDPLHSHDPTTPSADVRAISGASTTYDRGVLEAMRQAGVTPTDQVMLVGHSLGGMVAAGIAHDEAGRGRFDITHVITAGAPIARIAVPRSVQVLALENDGDVVPHLDAADNPDQTNETTVTLHDNHHDVVQNHMLLDGYLPGAAAVDASPDPSVRSYYASMAGFLTGTSVRTEVFHVGRT